ncbi:hypothetical protein [Sphingorhabdus contaminans]|uniref:hypothetical protein n=1 Tax=Sphingorhabdus contaminans TaxID=1343899 RepID=UPI003D2AB632
MLGLLAINCDVPILANEAQQSTPLLTTQDLIAIAETQRAYRPKDAFDFAPNVSVISNRFVVELPVKMAGAAAFETQCDGFPFWSYTATSSDAGSLMVHYTGGGTVVGSRYFTTVPVMCTERVGSSYVVQNAFGVKTRIERRYQVSTMLVSVRPVLAPPLDALLFATVDVSPADARTLTPNLFLRVEGELLKWPDSSFVKCGVEKTAVDMRTIWDVTTELCSFRTYVQRVSLVDRRSAKILAEKSFAERPED